MCIVANHGPLVPAPLQELARREIDLVGVYRRKAVWKCSPRRASRKRRAERDFRPGYCNLYPTALSLVSSGRVDLKPLISRTYPLAQANDAFAYFATGEPVKVLIRPSDPMCLSCSSQEVRQ